MSWSCFGWLSGFRLRLGHKVHLMSDVDTITFFRYCVNYMKREILFELNHSPLRGTYCFGCGSNWTLKKMYAKNMCASCYSGWSRQQKKWEERESFIGVFKESKLIYKKIAEKLYGKFPFCHLCGMRQWGFKVPVKGTKNSMTIVLVHHMDGNHSNNEPKNLMPLCASCHRKEHKRNLSTRGIDSNNK